MRILFVSHVKKNPDGGASRVYHLLEDGLIARGHTVKSIHLDDFGIHPLTEKIASRLLLPQAASRRAAREQLDEYDVIMSSSGMLYPLFRKLKQQPNRPLLVSHLHGSAFFGHQIRLNEAMRGHMSLSWMYRRITGDLPPKWDFCGSQYADLTIVQNGRDRDLLTERGFSPLVSIPLAVHPEIFAAGVSAPPPEQRDPYTLLWFGNWTELKGRYYLPSAFKQIVARYPDTRLSLWGVGVSAETIMRDFDCELRRRLTVRPTISRAEQIDKYGEHAIFLFPSVYEGFGFALLEAMSMGLAAVTTSGCFAADWLGDHKDAIIVPGGSALHLAKGTMELIEDNELRHRVARKGQETARLFTVDRMIDAYETAFENYRCRPRHQMA